MTVSLGGFVQAVRSFDDGGDVVICQHPHEVGEVSRRPRPVESTRQYDRIGSRYSRIVQRWLAWICDCVAIVA
jgi:hypothetical protein